MEEVNVPPFFLCPISLEIMKDPVTIPTGITYDRESIEKWIFSEKNSTCPVTKQDLSDPDLTPNHTLRRLIQSWCSLNASDGIERFPTPRPPVNKAQIVKLLNEAKSPQSQMKCLRRLKSIASINETNKRCIEISGGVEFLASLITSNTNSPSLDDEFCEITRASDEALSLLFSLQLSESGLKSLIARNDGFFECLTKIMQRGNYESRAYSVLLVKSLSDVADPIHLTRMKPELFLELVQILRDQISSKTLKTTLQLLINACQWGRNRVKAVEAGAVPVLIDLLLESSEKREIEMILMVLDQMCDCADGRSELLKHKAGLAVVSKKILRVSRVASERAVRILHSICKFSSSVSVIHEMLDVGVVAKLCLVLQVDCASKTKERAREILKSHARVWRNSSCIPISLISSFPSS
ncbi:E3 ubiquitin-protein ligase PUB23-like [Actinidia eriantha]|uniref:E3 ubiquitin-protein ligase PUB23-like n=1 Tax=Actinidia eriantha TaxID=165200 RepID=UPI0025899B71|nr:E3 ubiquitin-protein ligase PUB23-like [Actinidia eriantha]